MDLASSQERISAGQLAVGYYIYRYELGTWVPIVEVTASGATVSVRTEGTEDALVFHANEDVDVCAPLHLR